MEQGTTKDEVAEGNVTLSPARITTIYQAACLVLTTYEELEQVRASHASSPSQWPAETQVSEWSSEARDMYNAAMRRYVTALNRLVEIGHLAAGQQGSSPQGKADWIRATNSRS
ncbi:MAG: hypothetical protein ACRDG4_01435 [Chloroflexota bacterium]